MMSQLGDPAAKLGGRADVRLQRQEAIQQR